MGHVDTDPNDIYKSRQNSGKSRQRRYGRRLHLPIYSEEEEWPEPVVLILTPNFYYLVYVSV